ncbi:hypothetical protein BKA93DRAFT_241311 [Sparassis latifolia]
MSTVLCMMFWERSRYGHSCLFTPAYLGRFANLCNAGDELLVVWYAVGLVCHCVFIHSCATQIRSLPRSCIPICIHVLVLLVRRSDAAVYETFPLSIRIFVLGLEHESHDIHMLLQILLGRCPILEAILGLPIYLGYCKNISRHFAGTGLTLRSSVGLSLGAASPNSIPVRQSRPRYL